MGLWRLRPLSLATARAGRRTNAALLTLLGLSLATGTLSYAVGAPPATTVVTTAHATTGLALLLLVPWKRTLVRRGLRRAPHPGRSTAVALGWLLLAVVLSGLAQGALGWRPLAGVTPLQVHVLAALLAVPLVVRHAATHWQRPRAADLDRRTALRAGALVAGGLAGVAVLDGMTRALRLPGAGARPTGSTERGSGDPAAMPVTQWFTDQPPDRPPGRGLLVVTGTTRTAVDLAGGRDEVEAVLDCTGGWYAVQRWRGVRLDRLLPDPLPEGVRSLDVVSITGYRRRFPVTDAPRLLLATAVAGRPLSVGHGAPYRLVAPGRRGFWWVKWVGRVELSDAPPWRQPPFPLQ